ncbi:MAG TPA: gephyrin-like molybdotransferase Glp [Chitinophagaceae bacterium]|jgi:molybdopterin molybdotransferase|nr:gephyrin-like molybdotransferase Glp [Chitinophagaceae bacterium]
MISVAEAKKIVKGLPVRTKHSIIPLADALGLVNAEDIVAPFDIPGFNQSSMDGYAISYDGWLQHKELKIVATIEAGKHPTIQLKSHEAARIFTGAALPNGTDTVVMQEHVQADNETVSLKDTNVKAGLHVRPAGSEIKLGEIAVQKNTLLTPTALGFLASMGISTINVFSPPAIKLIITGNELQMPGEKPVAGKVYDSTSVFLIAALQQMGICDVQTVRVNDDLPSLSAQLKIALETGDLIIVTGGASVGDYDFLLQATASCEVSCLFHKVKQRPGKPLYLGIKNDTPVFGLPGNPASSVTCFYEYVLPVIESVTGRTNSLTIMKAPLSHTINKAAGLTHFLKGFYDGNTVTSLDAQESYRLSSFAKANCLIQLDEERTSIDKGENVEIHLLPIR